MRAFILALFLAASFAVAHAQTQNSASSDAMPGMDMSPGHSGDMQGTPGMDQGNAEAMHSMDSHHMDMGPHMKMTPLRAMQPGDQQKADAVVQAARAAAEKYVDYRVALADGFRIFLPNVPQKQYHFTNYRYASEAREHFDPSKPTSLLYEKNGNGYKLIGVMYTAKKDATEDELNTRIPLSITQWHAHVNLCVPPRDKNQEDVLPRSTKFGLRGSIATKEECDAAGGKFVPQIFGWMVHLYPFEKNAADVWSVERQHEHMD